MLLRDLRLPRPITTETAHGLPHPQQGGNDSRREEPADHAAVPWWFGEEAHAAARRSRHGVQDEAAARPPSEEWIGRPARCRSRPAHPAERPPVSRGRL